jgi:hypothetical protein
MITTSLAYASFFAFLTGLSGYFKNNKKLKLFHFIFVLVAEEVIPLKSNKLRIVWVIPNVFSYLIFIVFSAFVVTNWKGLEELNYPHLTTLRLFEEGDSCKNKTYT